MEHMDNFSVTNVTRKECETEVHEETSLHEIVTNLRILTINKKTSVNPRFFVV